MEATRIAAPHGVRGRHRPRRIVTDDVAVMLAQARLAQGWSFRAAARQAGCSAGMIVHLEQAQRAPSVVLARSLIGAYQLGDQDASLLLAQAVPDAGKSASWRCDR